MKTTVWIAVVAVVCFIASGVNVRRNAWTEGLRPTRLQIEAESRQDNCLATVQEELSSDVPVGDLPTSLDDVREPLHPFRVEGTTCALGAPFAFALAKKNTKKLTIYLVGGGACFSYGTCCGAASSEVYVTDVDLNGLSQLACLPTLRLDLAGLNGILADVPENPARDYSILLVPYCTGDVGLADVTATYTANNGTSCDVEHRGANNVMTAVNWALSVFSNGQNQLTDLIVAGDSAGAYAARFVSALALESLSQSQPDTPVKATLVPAAAVGLAAYAEEWEVSAAGLMPQVFAEDADHPQNTGFVDLQGLTTDLVGLGTGVAANQSRDIADLVYAYFEDNMQVLEMSYTRDTVQVGFGALSAETLEVDDDCGGGAPCGPVKFARFQRAAFERSASDVSSYAGALVTGTDHVIAIRDDFFDLTGVIYQGDDTTGLGLGQIFRQSVNRESVAPVTSFEANPIVSPSGGPSGSPGGPSGSPSVDPSGSPTVTPSGSPSANPSGSPTVTPSGSPTVKPSGSPTVKPSGSPDASGSPSADPSGSPAQTPAPTPEPSPTPFPTGPVADTVCFPADAEVETAGGTVRMDELAVGDHVRVGAEQWSEVFMFTHQHREVVTEMVRLEAGGRWVELSGTHYLQIGKELRAARAVEVGDTIELGNGTMAAVTGVRTARKRGLYNPQTLDGDIVVNGIRASTFTETVEPRLARMLLVVPKALYRLGVWNPFGGMFLEDNRLAAKLVPRGAKRQVIV